MTAVHPGLPAQLSVVRTVDLDPAAKDEIVALCTRAFDEDFSSLFQFVQSCDHVLAHLNDRLVGHAVWSTRWLQPAGLAVLRTAYVDAVATDPDFGRRGIGSAVMQRLAYETRDYDLRGLSTGSPGFYSRLGWERWLGSTGARRDGEIVWTPDETVMILRTPHTPQFDIHSLLTVEWRDNEVW